MIAARASIRHSRLAYADWIRWWTISGWAAMLAVFFLVTLPQRRLGHRLAFGLGVVCALSLALGCGGGSGGIGGGGGGGGGSVPTSVTLTTSNAKVASGVAPTLTATVNSTRPATGSVTFYNGSNAFAGPIALTNGQAQFSGLTFLPGVYQFTAKYSGDANDQPSTSQTLTQIFTGTVFQQIVAQTGGLVHSIPVNITLQ